MHDQLGTAGQGRVGDGVHVPDDEVRPVARFEQGVGAAVHADEDRSVLPDVRTQRDDVLLVVVAADHDQDLATLEVGLDVGNAHAVEQEVAFLAEVLHGVARERLELGGQPRTGLLHRGRHGFRRLLDALGHDVAPAVERLGVQAYGVALAQPTEHVRAYVVDQGDAGVDQDLRPEVGVAPADARRDVHDCGDAAAHERLGADPVQVDVVDDGDVAGLEALGEVLGPPVDANGAADAGERRRRAAS